MEEKKLKVELYECSDGDYVSISNGEVFVNIELDNGKGSISESTVLGLIGVQAELGKAREEGREEIMQSKVLDSCHDWKLVVEDINGQMQVCTKCGLTRNINTRKIT